MFFHRVRRGYKFKKGPIGNPDDPVWQAIVEMRRKRIEAGRRSLERGERYRDPYEGRFP